MSDTSAASHADVAGLSFEKALGELEAIVTRLERATWRSRSRSPSTSAARR